MYRKILGIISGGWARFRLDDFRAVCLRALCVQLTVVLSLFYISSTSADNNHTPFFSDPTPFHNFMRWVRGDELEVEVKTAEASATDDENLIDAINSDKTKEIKSVAQDDNNASLVPDNNSDVLPDFIVSKYENDVKINNKKVLDLSLPKGLFEDDFEFVLKDNSGVKMIDLFSAPLNNMQHDSSNTSFGGRLLMDEHFQQLEEYRLNDVRDSIEGAELTLEVKTN